MAAIRSELMNLLSTVGLKETNIAIPFNAVSAESQISQSNDVPNQEPAEGEQEDENALQDESNMELPEHDPGSQDSGIFDTSALSSDSDEENLLEYSEHEDNAPVEDTDARQKNPKRAKHVPKRVDPPSAPLSRAPKSAAPRTNHLVVGSELHALHTMIASYCPHLFSGKRHELDMPKTDFLKMLRDDARFKQGFERIAEMRIEALLQYQDRVTSKSLPQVIDAQVKLWVLMLMAHCMGCIHERAITSKILVDWNVETVNMFFRVSVNADCARLNELESNRPFIRTFAENLTKSKKRGTRTKAYPAFLPEKCLETKWHAWKKQSPARLEWIMARRK